MQKVIVIIAAVVDTAQLTLYKEDGSSIIIKQGDVRIRPLVEKVVPLLENNERCELTEEDLIIESYYKAAEESMHGFVRFFRAAKTTIDDILKKFEAQEKPVAPLAIGDLPISEIAVQKATATEEQQSQAPLTKSQAAVAEIMQNASPTSSPEFHAGNDEDTDSTVVAVLEDNTIIPGIEKISVQLQAIAAKLGSSVGVINFFKRVSSAKRAHSVQDLLTFMQKGELPIADDGSVLVYKRLQSTSEKGVYVDCHSKKVKQRVGSHVFMDESLVDPNRSRDCSNGLHVARRDYLSCFSGDVVVLAKLAPEDVIAVPHSDARKLRAKGYHIIFELSAEDASNVCSNRPMKDAVMLGNAASGNHVGVLETVQITQSYGGGLICTPVENAKEAAPVEDSGRRVESLDTLPVKEKQNSSIDAAKVAKNAGQAKQEGKSSRQIEAEALYAAIGAAVTKAGAVEAAKALLEFKKKAKVSWEKLGFSDSIGVEVVEISKRPVVEEAVVAPKPVAKPAVKKAAKPAAPAKPQVKKVAPKPVSKLVIPEGSPRQKIETLLKDLAGNTEVARAILNIKKQAKKSWSALGVSDAVVRKIEKQAQ